VVSSAKSALSDGRPPEADRADLTKICNAAVALHREHFGRGPGAARAWVTADLAICLLTDVFTVAERTLIDGGEGPRVLEMRILHHDLVHDDSCRQMGKVIGRPIRRYLSTVDVEEGCAVECFFLGD
jgi:uncharacterized protein YbcI